jgi:hypothetical protein
MTRRPAARHSWPPLCCFSLLCIHAHHHVLELVESVKSMAAGLE